MELERLRAATQNQWQEIRLLRKRLEEAKKSEQEAKQNLSALDQRIQESLRFFPHSFFFITAFSLLIFLLPRQ